MQDGSNKIGISVLVQMPAKGEGKPAEVKPKPNLEDQVRACIQRIDDGTGSEVDLLLLKRLKGDLLKKDKKNPRVKNLLEMIEPTLRRFGYYF
jgi:hypothetical protein